MDDLTDITQFLGDKRISGQELYVPDVFKDLGVSRVVEKKAENNVIPLPYLINLNLSEAAIETKPAVNILTEIVLKSESAANFPAFEVKYHFKDEHGCRILLKEMPEKVLVPSSIDDLKKSILTYAYKHGEILQIALDKSVALANNVTKIVEAIAPSFGEDIAPVRFKSDSGYTYHRLNFDPIECEALEKAPHWNSLVKRMGANGNAFCMRMGSLFDPNADRKQAVYIYDEKGDTGKSQIIAILERIFGPAFMTLSNEDLSSSFWRTTLVGKRLLVVNEATLRFINSESFKSITGDREHSVQQKGKPIYKTSLDTIVFFFSNTPPKLPGKTPLLNRVIAIELQPFTEPMLPEDDYQKLLESEMSYFIGYCLALYKPYYGGKRIPCDQSLVQELADSHEADALDFFDRHFSVAEEAFVTATELQGIFRKNMIPTQLQSRWIDVWRNKHGITHKRSKGESKGKRGPFCYYGIKIITP